VVQQSFEEGAEAEGDEQKLLPAVITRSAARRHGERLTAAGVWTRRHEAGHACHQKSCHAGEGVMVTLMKLRPWHCRYPLDEAARLFCGEVATQRANGTPSPYCCRHMQLCYVQGPYRPVRAPSPAQFIAHQSDPP
jgi:hypothetical protein